MTNTPTIAGLTDDAPCTDCDDTGIAFQTERRCACQPPLPMTDLPDRIRRMAERVDPEPPASDHVAWDDWLVRWNKRVQLLAIATPGALHGAVVDLFERGFAPKGWTRSSSYHTASDGETIYEAVLKLYEGEREDPPRTIRQISYVGDADALLAAMEEALP